MNTLHKCTMSLAAVLAVACANKDDDVAFERREITDAITASESLGVHFSDSVSGRLVKAAAPVQTDVGTLVADACTRTDSITTTEWRRHDLGDLPVTLLMPVAYARASRAHDDPPDSLAQTFRTNAGDEVTVMRRANAFDLVDVPELGKESSCLVDVEKIRVHVETGRRLPAGEIRTLSASYHLPTGGWLVLHGRAHDVSSQRDQLRVLREVRFNRMWQRPLS
jgi:hypothetical protein